MEEAKPKTIRTRTEGADEVRPLRGLEQRLHDVVELAELMQTYFSGRNSGLIDRKLINGLYVLIRNVEHHHIDDLSHLERTDFRKLAMDLSDLSKAQSAYAIQSEIVANNVAKLTRRAQRCTRSNDAVRQELAGISAKIGRLVGDETLPSLLSWTKKGR